MDPDKSWIKLGKKIWTQIRSWETGKLRWPLYGLNAYLPRNKSIFFVRVHLKNTYRNIWRDLFALWEIDHKLHSKGKYFWPILIRKMKIKNHNIYKTTTHP